MTHVAVVGAGLSGLAVARGLLREHEVTVFEKSRGVGGRMATRYEAGFEFDHGAQFFTARSPRFKECLQPLLSRGVVANWYARFAELNRTEVVSARDWDDEFPHYVGAPRMNQVGKTLAENIDVRLNTTVSELQRQDGGWRLADLGGVDLGRFDWVVLTAPAAQTAALAPAHSGLRALGEASRMSGCFALMLGFDEPLDMPWQAALIHSADISWISVNSSKPGRPAAFTLVVHSTNAYADTHIEENVDAVAAHLVSETSSVLGADCSRAFCRMQRWRYANMDHSPGPDFFIDEAMQIAACGDWFIRGRVEAAFDSGFALAGQLKGCL